MEIRQGNGWDFFKTESWPGDRMQIEEISENYEELISYELEVESTLLSIFLNDLEEALLKNYRI